MKVCLLNDSFPPVIDGVANAVVNYAKILTEHYDGAVVATPYYPDVVDDYPFPVVRYPSIDTTHMVGYRAGVPFSPESAARIQKEHVALLHSHCPVASTIFGRELRDLLDVPLVLTYHTKFDIDIANLVRSNRVQQAAIHLMVNNISACDEVWVVSRGAGENLKSLGYEGDYVVMENGVDFPRGRVPQDAVDELLARYAIPAGEPIYLFVGRMMWYKGLRLTLDALRRLKDAGKPFRMIFVGDGADRGEIESYARTLDLGERCIFTGAIHDREVLRAYFCAADLFLFPSTFDTNGLVVREAAACSLASVIVRGSCAAEGVTDGETGFFIEETAESMAELLLQIGGRREICRAVGQRAMEQIYLSWEDSVARAWDRYGVVCDNYRTAGKRAPVKAWPREFIRAIDDVNEGLRRLRESHAHDWNNDRYL